LSYNIFYQWTKKQAACHAQLPPLLHLDSKTELTGIIRKFHLPAHKQQCHTKFSLNIHPGAGHTDGEGIKHTWANINPAATSTKEMGEGFQHDMIDDLFGDWNYCKVVSLGKLMSCEMHYDLTVFLGDSLKTKLAAAIAAMALHLEEFCQFSTSFSNAMTDKLLAMVLAWESDNTKPNPYVITTSCMSFLTYSCIGELIVHNSKDPSTNLP
jgi:Kyakuja-Dileera-Zisupton transposase